MRIVPLVLLAAIVGTPAMAADLGAQSEGVPAAAVAYAFSWTGPEFGVFAGGDWLNATGSKFSGDTYRFPGGHIGAFAGYQYQLRNNLVLGVEGDVSYTSNQRDDFVYSVSDLNGNTYSFDEKIRTDISGSVRARVGYAFKNVLLYATGGWAATRAVDNINLVGDYHETFSGFTVGAGVDYAFTDNVFARAEYRYNKFGEKTFDDGTAAKLDQHLVNVALGVKF